MMNGPVTDSLKGAHVNLQATQCPTCKLQLAEERRIAGRRTPGANDVSICRGCGEIVALVQTADGLVVRLTTASEFLSLSDESRNLLRVAHTLVNQQLRVRNS
jgi:hypothetical protein